MTSEEEKFVREKDLVERLLLRLGLDWQTPTNPNTNKKQTGIDVLVPLTDGRNIGARRMG